MTDHKKFPLQKIGILKEEQYKGMLEKEAPKEFLYKLKYLKLHNHIPSQNPFSTPLPSYSLASSST